MTFCSGLALAVPVVLVTLVGSAVAVLGLGALVVVPWLLGVPFDIGVRVYVLVSLRVLLVLG